MKNLSLNKAQRDKTIELCLAFSPNYEWSWETDYCGYEIDDDIINEIRYSKDENPLHWFEFLFVHLIPFVAKELAKQPSITENYANYLLQQKTLTEMRYKNPIDNVYEVWKNPIKYIPEA